MSERTSSAATEPKFLSIGSTFESGQEVAALISNETASRSCARRGDSGDGSSGSSGGEDPAKPLAALAATKLPLSLGSADHSPAPGVAGEGAASGWIIHQNNGDSFHADNYEQCDGTITAKARYRSVSGAEGHKRIRRYGELTDYGWPASTVKIREVKA